MAAKVKNLSRRLLKEGCDSAPDLLDMRERIKLTALQALTREGYRGFRFNEIAENLGITRANIHYHFGKKERLVEVVLEEYVEETLARYRAILLGSNSYASKIEAVIEFHRERYQRYNCGLTGNKPWSVISRLRLETDLLSPRAQQALSRYSTEIDQYVAFAVQAAKERGELSAEAPTRDLVMHVASFILSAVAITQDAGAFSRLEDLYRAHLLIVQSAYGRGTRTEAVNRKVKKT